MSNQCCEFCGCPEAELVEVFGGTRQIRRLCDWCEGFYLYIVCRPFESTIAQGDSLYERRLRFNWPNCLHTLDEEEPDTQSEDEIKE